MSKHILFRSKMEVFHHDVQTIIYRYTHQNSTLKLNVEYHELFQPQTIQTIHKKSFRLTSTHEMRFLFNYREQKYCQGVIFNIKLIKNTFSQIANLLPSNYWYTSTTFLEELEENELKGKNK